MVGDFFKRVGRAEEILGEAAAAGGIIGGERGFAAVGTKAGVAPLEQAGEGVGREGAGFAEAAEQGVAPEFTEGFPAAGVGEVKGGVGGEDAGSREHVNVGMPEQVVAKDLHGDDEAGLAGGAGGAFAQPEGEDFVGGVVEFAEQGGLALEIPRRTRGRVSTRWRWGTGWQISSAMAAASVRVRRWWQEAQRPRCLQVKARR